MMIGPNDMPTRPRTEAEFRTYEFVWPHPVGPGPDHKAARQARRDEFQRERRFWRCVRFLAWCWLQIVLICVLWSATGLRDAYLKPAPPAIVRPA